MQNLQDAIATILQCCLDEQGMKPPLIVCGISPNGSVCAVRCRSDFTRGEPLAEHYEARGFVLPMTVVVIDQDNAAFKAELCVEDGIVGH